MRRLEAYNIGESLDQLEIVEAVESGYALLQTRSDPGYTRTHTAGCGRCLLVAPESEGGHLTNEGVVFIYQINDEEATGVVLQKPTTFTMNEMAPDFDDFDENVMYRGGEEGGQSVLMFHPHGDLDGCRNVGNGIFVGGVQNAKQAVWSGMKPASTFQFFFNHLTFSTVNLEGMLSENGGWKVLRFPEQAMVDVVLSPGEGEIWSQLHRRIKGVAEAVVVE